MGSSIVETGADRPRCPGATLQPERFKSLILKFGATQKAYLYFRRELSSGDEPAAGRGYVYQGYVAVPFQAYGQVGDSLIQLQVMFTERQITDDNGSPAGFTQPLSQNGQWLPTTESHGGHEYLNFLDAPYSDAPDPAFAQDGAFASGTSPVLFGGWLRRESTDAFDATDELVLGFVNMAGGGAGLDASWGNPFVFASWGLYLANGDATSRLTFLGGYLPSNFDDVEPGVLRGGRSGVWGDFDRDGDADLYVIGAGGSNRLLLSQPTTGISPYGLVDVTAGPLAGPGASTHAAWADYDRDGDLDLYVVNGPNPNQLLRNDGAAGFSDATAGPLVGRPDGRRAVWADFDGDLDPDLYLSNGMYLNQLLRNDRHEGFADVTPAALDANGVDAAWGDFDNDGDPDLLLVGQTSQLLRNDGGSSFADVTPPALIGGRRNQRAAWVDFDDDADLDLVIADALVGFRLIRNDGGGIFADATPGEFLRPIGATALALADYDEDGDHDFYLVSPGRNWLVRNDLARARWIRVALEGVRSQRQGIGARVSVTARGVTQTREITAADPPPLAATFGVGGATVVDEVVVRWPSGAVSRLTGVPLYSRLTIAEGASTTPNRLSFARAFPNPANGAQQIELLVPGDVTAVTLRIHDLAGRLVWERNLSGLQQGVNAVAWDGHDTDGRALPAGVYFTRASHAGGEAHKRIVRLR